MADQPVELTFEYHPLLNAFGVPFRLTHNARRFELGKALSSVELSSSRVLTTQQQRRMLAHAFEGDTGWLMYVCAPTILDRARHLAAHVTQRYFERDLKVQWLTQLHKLDRVRFGALKLVVFDALFYDSSPARRDLMYETIANRCNVEGQSVIVIGQHASPLDLAQQLGMRADFMVQTK